MTEVEKVSEKPLKVSVIVTACNSRPSYYSVPYLHEALVSLIESSYRPLEIVVVDDGSTDGSVAYVDWAREHIVPKDVELICLRNPTNRGVGNARNRGLRAASGAFLAILDHDDVMLPNGITQRVDFLQRHNVEVVYARRDVLRHDGYLRRVERYSEPYQSDGFTNLRTNGEQFQYLLRERATFGHATLLYRRHVLDVVGFFREERELMGLEHYGWLLKLFHHFFAHYLDRPVFLLRRGHRPDHLASEWEGNPDRSSVFDTVLVPHILTELDQGLLH